MAHRIRLGLLLPFLATAAVGCSDDPPAPMVDAGGDAGGDAGTDVGGDTGADTGADGGALCPSIEFVRPTAAAVLGVADDADNNCSNGFAYTVQVATNAVVGTQLQLFVNNLMVSTATVSGPTVRFEAVQFDTGAMSSLEVRVAGETASCGRTTLSVSCAVPRCSITAPMRSTLNATDSTAAAGAPFATTFTVGTDVEDGREVELSVTGTATPLRAAVMAGVARFNNVALAPDGEFVARATCTNRAGNVGRSAEGRFTVDSVAPTLTVQSPMANTLIGLSGDVNATVAGVQFNVCARSDAAGRRVCASVMGSTPADPAGCADVPASATTDACVQVTCPDGGAPFTVEVSTQDAAGNIARASITNVRCQSALPSVRVVAPLAYDAADPGTILNASRDGDTSAPGYQTEVVACTDRMAGTAELLRDMVATPIATATVTPTMAGDPCATLGMGFVGIARFTSVTLPETSPSRTEPSSSAPTGPNIRVQVTDPTGDRGASVASVLYVDSSAPTLNIFNCNRLVAPGTDGTARTAVVVSSDAYPINLTLERMGDMPRQFPLTAPSTSGTGTFSNLQFFPGVTTLRLSATDPAGNASATNGMCTVTVGNPPTLAFTSPTPGARFTTATTTVTLATDAPVGTVVSLSVNGGTPVTGTVAGGMVTFIVALPEGDAVNLTAATAEVAGRGVGTASVTVLVDTVVPTAPTAFAASIPTTPRSARRAGIVRLAWNDGSDANPSGTGTRPVGRYEVRYSTAAITASNFAGATLAVVTATPGAPGAANTADVNGLQLGRTYYFAIRAFDAAGNASASVVSAGPLTPDLVVDEFPSTSPLLGNAVSGGHDLNGDGIADVVLASSTTGTSPGGFARIYFGSATGLSATNFAEFRGAVSDGRFGTTVASLGDINGDGLGDVAMGEPGPTSGTRAGSVYLFFGRPAAMWRQGTAMAYVASEANVTIAGGTGDFATARLGATLARVGNFDGDADGLNDVAMAATFATGGGAVVLFRGRRTWPATLAPNGADLIIRNNGTSTVFGISLAGAGRLLGNDALEDLAVGGGSSATPAAAYVFAGRSLATPVALSVTDATFTRPGIAPGSVTGSTAANGQNIVAGVGDINGDGRSDFAVGNIGSTGGAGEVALYFGGTSGGLEAGPSVRATAQGTVNDVFGRSIASIPDPTQVRPSLLLGGAPSADLLLGSVAYRTSSVPRVYVYRGRASASWAGQTTDTADRAVLSPTGGAGAIISGIAWIGDVDSDGAVDAAFTQAGSGSLFILR